VEFGYDYQSGPERPHSKGASKRRNANTLMPFHLMGKRFWLMAESVIAATYRLTVTYIL
jgi:hypothetical protein